MGTNEELQYKVIEALQAAYPYLSKEQLEVLCYVAGITVKEAFPWHDERRAA